MSGAVDEELWGEVRGLLEAHWDPARGYCVPNPTTYPHLWLWDSCFHAIVWAHLEDMRAVTELASTLAGQLPGGLVPHMRYGGEAPDTFLGPLDATSSLAQPPMFSHTIRILQQCGMRAPELVATAGPSRTRVAVAEPPH